jgi:hypothetical protein
MFKRWNEAAPFGALVLAGREPLIHDHGVVPMVEGVTADHHNLSHHGQERAFFTSPTDD